VDEWERLDKEWLVGRAERIYGELRGRYEDLATKRTPRRLPGVMAAMEAAAPSAGLSGGDALLAITAQATAQVSAENILLALATYLAEHETPTPSE
jgi:hypothetical protein